MKDFDLKFERHPMTGDVSVKSGNNALLQSIRNIVLTCSGDWKAEQGFGVGVDGALGENDTDVIGTISLKNRITNQIEIHEPRVELKTVNVVFENGNHRLRVFIEFLPVNQQEIIKFNEYIDVLI